MTTYASRSGVESDIGIFFVACMLTLTFPAGLVLVAVVSLLVILQEKTGVAILDFVGSNPVGTLLMWVLFVVAGYWQWFVVFPRTWKLIRTRMTRK